MSESCIIHTGHSVSVPSSTQRDRPHQPRTVLETNLQGLDFAAFWPFERQPPRKTKLALNCCPLPTGPGGHSPHGHGQWPKIQRPSQCGEIVPDHLQLGHASSHWRLAVHCRASECTSSGCPTPGAPSQRQWAHAAPCCRTRPKEVACQGRLRSPCTSAATTGSFWGP